MRRLFASFLAILMLLAAVLYVTYAGSGATRSAADEAQSGSMAAFDDGPETTDAGPESAVDAEKGPNDGGDADGAAVIAPWSRIAIIGASASDGFGARMDFVHEDRPVRRRVTMSRIIETITPGDVVAAHASSMFFLNPTTVGSNQLQRAIDAAPTAIIAIDWLFWYGYGSQDKDGHPLREESQRLELLDAALAMLEPVECLLVLGDYPDMSPAVGGMLGRAQMPAAETLNALNTRLRDWAAERDNVVIVSMDALIDNVRNGRGFTIDRPNGSFEVPGNSESVLLQADQLHPTVDGMIAIAQAVVAAVEEATGAAWPLSARADRIHEAMIARWIEALSSQ